MDIQGEMYENCIRNRTLYLWGEIDFRLTEALIQEMNFLRDTGDGPISIFIHSPGGDTDCEAALIDEILGLKYAGVVMQTIVIGCAFSAASSILALGTKGYRFARPNSSIMLHPASIGIDTDYEGQQKCLLDFMIKKNEQVNQLVADACGMKKKYNKFIKDIDKGLWLTSQEALKYGVIDGIWKGPLPPGGKNEQASDKRRIR